MERVRLRVGLFVMLEGSVMEMSSILVICGESSTRIGQSAGNCKSAQLLELSATCFLTRSIILSINGPGHGSSSGAARSATQNRVSC